MNEKQLDIFDGFYKDKRVLVTGHTGFKGSWLSIWLHALGAKVYGVALDPSTPDDNYVLSRVDNLIEGDYRADIVDKDAVRRIMNEVKPDIVFHLAAQPLVRLSYEIPVETYMTNVMGTIHVLEAIRSTPSVKVGVMITTDKCYENCEQLWGYRENDPMGGYDPYSSSKGAAEIAISSWRRSFFNPSNFAKHGKSIASVRAGNVVGGGDWAVDRIVPDCIRAIEKNEAVRIRSPKAIRPWQHVLEPLGGYMLLARKMWENPGKYCEAWNFGPDPESVANVWQMASLLIDAMGRGELVDASTPTEYKESNILMLDITKARMQLDWRPRLTLSRCMELTAHWYRNYRINDCHALCLSEIDNYINNEPLPWN